ncbi:MAG: hypothetical protein GXO54_02020 [Chloroflexi bacterium]|nr:hypothetical protein [Chloroflexota bacterium]
MRRRGWWGPPWRGPWGRGPWYRPWRWGCFPFFLLGPLALLLGGWFLLH